MGIILENGSEFFGRPSFPGTRPVVDTLDDEVSSDCSTAGSKADAAVCLVGSFMIRLVVVTTLSFCAGGVFAQSAAPRPKFDAFEVATIKPVDPDAKAGRYIIMQGNNRFVEKAYTLKLLIAAAYDLNPRTISGGPGWVESDHYDIVAVTPGEVRPTHDEQMSMLRNLLTDRFKLMFHREEKVFSIYELEVAKNGPKLKASTAPPDDPPALISTVYPQRIVMPARNATVSDLARLMQRAILDTSGSGQDRAERTIRFRPGVGSGRDSVWRRGACGTGRCSGRTSFFGDSATARTEVGGDQGTGSGACRR